MRLAPADWFVRRDMSMFVSVLWRESACDVDSHNLATRGCVHMVWPCGQTSVRLYILITIIMLVYKISFD